MAKFTFEYDSESKELIVTSNGTKLENVRDVMFYGDYQEEGKKRWKMGIVQAVKNNDGTRTVIQTTAATLENLQALPADTKDPADDDGVRTGLTAAERLSAGTTGTAVSPVQALSRLFGRS